MKMTGADFKGWQASEWGEDTWWEDFTMLINGVEVEDYNTDEIADTDEIEVIDGVVFLCKSGERSQSASRHFNAWKKAQTTLRLVVDVDRDVLEQFEAFVKGLKGAKVASDTPKAGWPGRRPRLTPFYELGHAGLETAAGCRLHANTGDSRNEDRNSRSCAAGARARGRLRPVGP